MIDGGLEAHFPLESHMQFNQALNLTIVVEDNLESSCL